MVAEIGCCVARFSLDLDGLLPDAAVAAFERDGFLSIDQLIDDDELTRSSLRGSR
jgi:hypothetical protein